MPLSANTLIHFTKEKSSLKGILENNFEVNYCYETIELDSKINSYYVPMVSFCDIPLSEIKDHLSKYGEYGIGLTKQWGEKNGLNPVLYVSRNSILSKSIKNAVVHFVGQSLKKNCDADEAKSLLDVLRYIKNYEADLKRRNGEITPNYRFSDEREWRYVPKFSEHIAMIMAGSSPQSDISKNTAKLKDFKLKFEPNDIKYIIIKDDSEIAEFINHLESVKSKHFSKQDIQRLTTRIITSEQIKTDI